MSSLFADVLGSAAAEPPSTAAAALFNASSAFKRGAATTEKGSKKKSKSGLSDDAVGKHAASRRRPAKTTKGVAPDDTEDQDEQQLGLLRSQAEAAAQAAAAARKQEGGGNSDGFDSSDSEDEEGDEEDGSGEEDELERLAALRDGEQEEEEGDEDEEGDEEGEALAPGTPPAAAHASLTPEQQLERLSRTVFVGNVSPTSKRKSLKRVFSEFGKVESVRLRSVPLAKGTLLPRRAAVLAKKADASRKGGACAYVVFEERSGAEKALSLNMEEVGGNVVRVDFASAPSARGAKESENGSASAPSSPSSFSPPPSLYDPALSVFVGNLPPDVEESDLVTLFGGKTAVAAVRVVRDPSTSLGKGFAFVLLRDSATAAAAKARDGMLLKGRAVRVRKAAKDPGVLAAAKLRREESAKMAFGGGGGRGGGARGGGARGRGGGSFAGGRGRGGRGPATPADRLRAAAATAGGGGSAAAAAPEWQGVRTKGRGGKVSRGFSGAPKAGLASGGASSSSSSSSASAKSAAAGKRPSVAARKEASKALKVRGGGVVKQKKPRHRNMK